ncbi:hypothetical protein CS063_16870 [Sporanaerobium hydrogeniformans]|uniref:Uncharacterized protein n=1 Tax=Sporanaerobium hydrogeniformans TaxID=3072179 RepID=A0AC61D8Y8_9FIRM|nr:DUF429 domain-containing protein [Sporanaerobium hydrogeniformans]PHV69236.1 hypothetical protein CS063_16870 [Sporanaerobium hydrogeniformans]
MKGEQTIYFMGISIYLKEFMVAILDGELRICQLTCFGAKEVVNLMEELKPKVIAVDAPYKLSQGLMNNPTYRKTLKKGLRGHYNKRVCEYELSKRNIQIYSTPQHIAMLRDLKEWMWSGFALYKQIEEASYTLITSLSIEQPQFGFIEVFSHGAYVSLLKHIPNKKETIIGQRERIEVLEKWGIKGVERWLLNKKIMRPAKLDALVAAYTAYLTAKGEVSFVGELVEGEIVLPTLVLKETYTYSEAYKKQKHIKEKERQRLQKEAIRFTQLKWEENQLVL